MNKKRAFELAKKAAKESPFEIRRHGAVLIRGGKILSSGFNLCVHSKLSDRFKKHAGEGTRHAEVAAILGIDKKVTSGADIYVVRLNKKGELKNSRPCLMCQDILKFVGVRRAFYSISDTEYGVLKI